jgi:hypothetical protein
MTPPDPRVKLILTSINLRHALINPDVADRKVFLAKLMICRKFYFWGRC